jgi:hypothetical protein
MKSALLLLSVLLLPGLASATPLTNADIIKMSEAKLDETIILTTIENSEPKFDTSTQGLIELSGAHVAPSVITAIIKRANATGQNASSTASVPPSAQQVESMSPSEVLMIDVGETKPMRYITPQVRTGARALGFGGFASYAVLRGSQASTRTKNTQPSFVVSVPNQAQPESYMTLASFAVRKNNSREVLIGGGYMSYSSGIIPDRVIAVTSEKTADQSRAQKGFIVYRVTPKRPLKVGEYAVILYTSEMQGLVGAWFTGAGNSYFDFGVDP